MPRWIEGKLSAPTRDSPWNPFTVYHQRTLTQTQRPRPMAEYWYDEAYHGPGLAVPQGFFAVHIGVPHSCHFCSKNFWQYPISHCFLSYSFLGFILFCKCARYIAVSLFLQTLSISIRLCYCSQVLYGFVCVSTNSFRVVSTWNLTVLSQVLLVLSQFILIMNRFVLISSNDSCACTLLTLYPYIQILLIVVSLRCLGKEISIYPLLQTCQGSEDWHADAGTKLCQLVGILRY